MSGNTGIGTIWEDPPSEQASRATGQFARELAGTLIENPNLWAVLGRYKRYDTAKNMKRHYRSYERTPFVDAGYQFTVGRTGEKQWTLYVRYSKEPEAMKESTK